ncbi:glycosyltransferase [Carnobacterium alterfunditum]|uniref:glycosyltransferase n=1 Tax=Carnobacterium alterfunditum TaxID=28230 RepID=UPI0035948D25
MKKNKKNKILFVVPVMNGIGGIQSSLINLMSNLGYEYDVYLCVIGNYIDKKTPIPDSVKIVKGSKLLEYAYIDYDKQKDRFSFFEKIMFTLIKIIKKTLGLQFLVNTISRFFKVKGHFDTAIAFSNDIYRDGKLIMGGANRIVEKSVSADKKHGWIHNEAHREGLTETISKKTYKNFDTIVNVSYGCKTIFDNIIPAYKEKSKVAYNTFKKEEIIKKANSETNPFSNNVFNIVTVARVDNTQKRIDKVIECGQLLVENGFTDFKWYIVGDGPNMSELQDLVKDKGLTKYIIFEGRKSNPFVYMKHADVMVMTSDYEAYPMVSKESMIVGTPVICTQFPSANEVVDHQKNGLITGFDTIDIFKAIKECMVDPNLLNSLSNYLKSNEVTNEKALAQFDSIVRS